MIITGFLLVVIHFVGPFLNAFLPKLVVGTLPSLASTVLTRLGSDLQFMSPLIPVSVFVAWLTIWGTVGLAAAAYAAFEWVWAHIPTILGFGTGDG